jgi:hypothetical protein
MVFTFKLSVLKFYLLNTDCWLMNTVSCPLSLRMWNNLLFLLPKHYFAVYIAVRLMIIDAQNLLAVRIYAFPVNSRCLQHFYHRNSFR